MKVRHPPRLPAAFFFGSNGGMGKGLLILVSFPGTVNPGFLNLEP